MIFDPVDARKLLEMGVPQWRVALKYDIHRRTLMRRLDERSPCTQAAFDLLNGKNDALKHELADVGDKLERVEAKLAEADKRISSLRRSPDLLAKLAQLRVDKNLRISELTNKVVQLERVIERSKVATKKKASTNGNATKRIKRMDAKNQVLERKVRSLQREIAASHGGETEDVSLTPLMGAFFQNNNQDLMNHNVKVVTLTQEEVDRSNRIGRI